jgi:hypothetical protein
LVLDGAFSEGGEGFAPQSWLRLPPHGRLNATTGNNGCTVWVKTGHLRHIQVPPMRRPKVPERGHGARAQHSPAPRLDPEPGDGSRRHRLPGAP